MKKLLLLLAAWLPIIILPACRDIPSDACCQGGNGIYYWRTTFSLSDDERAFLKKHGVNKLYIKFFDVERDYKVSDDDGALPEATIRFRDTVPAGIEVIPAVYITPYAIEAMQLKEAEYAEKIFRRVIAMCRANNFEFKELQLDCDWTKHSRDYFFKLCEEIKSLMDSTQTLSCTIRLHQLVQTPPPVDKGVLMVYNTGNLMEMTTDNSIFSWKDIEPYLRVDRLSNYSLPLDVAYPAYGWSLDFYPEGGKYKFNRIMQRTDFSDYPAINLIGDSWYEVTETVNLSNVRDGHPNYLFEGHRIRVERPSAIEILEIKNMIDRLLAGKPHNTILYHLDETQLSHYTDNEINKIYSRD